MGIAADADDAGDDSAAADDDATDDATVGDALAPKHALIMLHIYKMAFQWPMFIL